MNHIKLFEEFKYRESQADEMEDFCDLHIDEIAQKFGKTIVKKLGQGSFGNAYLTRDNMVIKITADEEEFSNALNLIQSGIKYKHIVNYYKGYNLGVKDSYGGLYVLLLDYIRPLTKEERSYWNWGTYFFKQDIRDDQIISIIQSNLSGYRLSSGAQIKGIEEDKATRTIKYFEKLLPQRQAVLEEFKRAGELGEESHGGNLGMKDGNLVYYDVGYGDVVEGTMNPYKHERVDVENNYKKMREMIQSDYEKYEFIPINELVEKVSKLLNVNRVKAWKYLRDEAAYTEMVNMGYLLGFVHSKYKEYDDLGNSEETYPTGGGKTRTRKLRFMEIQLPYGSNKSDYSMMWF